MTLREPQGGRLREPQGRRPREPQGRAIVLAIKTEYAEKIYNGEKTVEFRRRLPKEDIEVVYLYESSPVRKITGEFHPRAVLRDKEPVKLWSLLASCQEIAGLSYAEYAQYFIAQKTYNASCICIDTATINKYRQPLELSDLGIRRAPQNFGYVK
jgi:predicted transcriptional regulator